MRSSQAGWSRMVMALLLAAVTVVMIFEIRRALDPAASQKPEPVLPEKLRSRERTVAVPTEPVLVTPEIFNARLAAGLPIREVRWITEDFIQAGLAESVGAAPPEAYLVRRTAQHRWLLDTLAQGLGLSSAQREQTAAALEAQMETAEEHLAGVVEGGSSFEVDGKLYQLINASDLNEVVYPKVWIEAEIYAPWNLCGLDPGQAAVVGMADIGEFDEAGPGAWILPRASVSIADAGVLFPFPAEQAAELDSLGPDLLKQAARLHPAQLRTLLLLRPEIAPILMTLADAAAE